MIGLIVFCYINGGIKEVKKMREIKFRYRFRKFGTDEITTKIYSIQQLETTRSMLFDFLTYEILFRDMFTGLFDKNGKEIYEGDIIQFDSGATREVCFVKGSFVIDTGGKVCGIGGTTCLGNFVTNRFKVIGNIFENPELMEGIK